MTRCVFCKFRTPPTDRLPVGRAGQRVEPARALFFAHSTCAMQAQLKLITTGRAR